MLPHSRRLPRSTSALRFGAAHTGVLARRASTPRLASIPLTAPPVASAARAGFKVASDADALARLPVTAASRLVDASILVCVTGVLLPALCAMKVVCLATWPLDFVTKNLNRWQMRAAQRRSGICERRAALLNESPS